jgi:hypothetical protein
MLAARPEAAIESRADSSSRFTGAAKVWAWQKKHRQLFGLSDETNRQLKWVAPGGPTGAAAQLQMQVCGTGTMRINKYNHKWLSGMQLAARKRAAQQITARQGAPRSRGRYGTAHTAHQISDTLHTLQRAAKMASSGACDSSRRARHGSLFFAEFTECHPLRAATKY